MGSNPPLAAVPRGRRHPAISQARACRRAHAPSFTRSAARHGTKKGHPEDQIWMAMTLKTTRCFLNEVVQGLGATALIRSTACATHIYSNSRQTKRNRIFKKKFQSNAKRPADHKLPVIGHRLTSPNDAPRRRTDKFPGPGLAPCAAMDCGREEQGRSPSL